jgi:tetraacyldisaccharide 4'-kinase
MMRALRRVGLRPFSPMYSGATALRNLAYGKRWLASRRLPARVISVGNLSTGGTGKTPFVMALSHLLQDAGWLPILLSRGYGRNSREIVRVNPSGSAQQFGDEPLLLARETNAPVYVGGSRYHAGLMAAHEIALTPRHVFVLDDGFQHRRLLRDVDIVLLRAADLNDELLPAGNLREPATSLSRADMLVVRDDEAGAATQVLSRFSPSPRGALRVWTVRRTLDLAGIPPGTAIAFAGIAHPSEFFRGLRAAGFTLPSTLAFADHHDYSFRDVTRILAALKIAQTRTLLTTEKDFVRLTSQARVAMQNASDLRAVPLRTEIMNAETCLQQIEALLEKQR